MKKIVVSAFSLFLLGAVSASAQTTTGGQSGTEAQTSTQSATPSTTPAGTPTGTASGTPAGAPSSTGTTTQTDATSTGTATTGNAATGTTTDAAATGTTVALEELPAPVKATLASEKLKTWTPSTASLVKDAAGKEYYSIELKQGNQIGTVKLGKDGKPVK